MFAIAQHPVWDGSCCSEMPIQSYRDLEAGQIGMDFVVGVYAVTKSFSREV